MNKKGMDEKKSKLNKFKNVMTKTIFGIAFFLCTFTTILSSISFGTTVYANAGTIPNFYFDTGDPNNQNNTWGYSTTTGTKKSNIITMQALVTNNLFSSYSISETSHNLYPELQSGLIAPYVFATVTLVNHENLGNGIHILLKITLNKNGFADLKNSFGYMGTVDRKPYDDYLPTAYAEGYISVSGYSGDATLAVPSKNVGKTISINNGNNCLSWTSKKVYPAFMFGSGYYDQPIVRYRYNTGLTLPSSWSVHAVDSLPTVSARTGYDFEGFYTGSNGSGSKVTTIDAAYNAGTIYCNWVGHKWTNSLNYNANNGTGAPSATSSPATYPNTSVNVSVTSSKPSRAGYNFAGWGTTTNSGVNVGSTYAVGSNNYDGNQSATLYAQWTPITYTNYLNYNANGGTGAPSATSSAATYPNTSVSVSVTSSKPTRAGYNFAGWGTTTNSGVNVGSTYTVGSNDYAGDQSATVYAQWTPKTVTNKLQYNLNGGNTGPSDQTDTITYPVTESKFTVGSNATKTGYNFAGWYDENGTKYDPGEIFTISTNNCGEGITKTLNAHWTGINYTVNYKGNGATSGDEYSDTYVYGTEKALAQNNFVRKYKVNFDATTNGGTIDKTFKDVECNFTGWYSNESGTNGTAYSAGQLVTSVNGVVTEGGSTNLYAQWTPGTITLPLPEKTGFNFTGWYDAPSGGNLAGMNGETFSPSSEEMALYACFSARVYNIEFNGNGATSGSMDDMSDVLYIDEVTLSENTYLKHNEVSFDSMGGIDVSNIGYDSDFLGWSRAVHGSVDFDDKDVVKELMPEDHGTIKLFAMWDANEIILPLCSKSGYLFAGWYHDNLLSTFAGWNGDTYKPLSDEDTLYAKFIDLSMILADKTYANDFITLDDEIEIYDGLVKLIVNQDYTLDYSNNFEVSNNGTNLDTAHVTITGAGHYSGSKINSFNIIPKKILVSDLELPDDETGIKITKIKNNSKKASTDVTHFGTDELKPFVFVNNETLTFSYEDAFIATPSGTPDFYGDKESIKNLKNVKMTGISMDDDSGSYTFCNELGQDLGGSTGNYLFANASYLIDKEAPSAESIEIVNTENKLEKGDTLSFVVVFNERMKYTNINDVYLSYTFGSGSDACTFEMPLKKNDYSGDDDNYSTLTFSKVLNDLPDDKMIGGISNLQIVCKNDGVLTDMGGNEAIYDFTGMYDLKDFYFVTLNFGVTLESEYDEDTGIAKFMLTINSERPLAITSDEIKAAIGCKGIDIQTGSEMLINLLTTSGVTINELVEKQKFEIIFDTYESNFITDVNTKGRELSVFLSKEAIRDDISNFNKPVEEKVKVLRTLKDNNIKISYKGNEVFLNPKDNHLYLDKKYSKELSLTYNDKVKFETLDSISDVKLNIAHLINGTRVNEPSDNFEVVISNSLKQIDEIYEWKEDYARAGFIKVIFDVYSLDRLANIKEDIYDKIISDSTISYDDKIKKIEDELTKLFTNEVSKQILINTGDLDSNANHYVVDFYDPLIGKELIRTMDNGNPITIANLTTILNDISKRVDDYYAYIQNLDNLIDKKNKKEDISSDDVDKLIMDYYNLDPFYRDYLDNNKDHKKKIDEVKQIYYDKKADDPVTGTDNLVCDIIVPGVPTDKDKNPKNLVEERFELIGSSNLIKFQGDSITLSGEFISDEGVVRNEKDYLSSSKGFDFGGKDILYSNDLYLKNQDMQDVVIKQGENVVLLLDLDKDLANLITDIYMINYTDSSKTSVSSSERLGFNLSNSSNSGKKTLTFNASSIGSLVLIKRTNYKVNIELTGVGGSYLGPKTIPITRDVEQLEITLLSGSKAVISKNGKTDDTLTETGIYELTDLNSANSDVNIKISFSKSGGSGGSGGGGGGGGGGGAAMPILPDVKNPEERMVYIQGLSDGTFKPEDNLNRASLATIINKLLSNGEELDEKEIEELFEPYGDINPKSWYAQAIAFCIKNGFISGYDDFTVRPYNNITRAEVCKILSLAFEIKDKGITNNFNDEISGEWFETYVDKLVRAGILNGFDDGTIKGNNPIRRCEAVIMLNRVLERDINKEELDKLDNPFKDIDKLDWYYYDIIESAVSHTYE